MRAQRTLSSAIMSKMPSEEAFLRWFYAVVVLLYLRDYCGVYRGCLTRKRSTLSKPNCASKVFRRPGWCAPAFLQSICDSRTQNTAFALALATSAMCCWRSSLLLRLAVALSLTVVSAEIMLFLN